MFGPVSPSGPTPAELSGFHRIFVGGLPRGTTEVQLRAAFAFIGMDVGNIEFVIDRVTGVQRGFAFVDLRAPIGRTDAAFGQLRLVKLDGHPLDIQGVPAPSAARNRSG